MTNQLYIIIGAFGSGKSEYSVHFARQLNAQGLDVVLADLDVVNPYFRTRDVREAFIKEGIEVIAPDGQFSHADVPMISPRIKGAIENLNKTVVLDVGGDPAGCRALGRFEEQIKLRGYQMQFVINTSRPFTSNADDIIKMQEMLEFTSRQKITELVCNANLMEYTDEQIVTKGIAIIEEVSKRLSLPFNKYLVLEKYEKLIPANIHRKQREVMIYTFRKPWEIVKEIGM
jgi:tRNA uridine 5-carbamoylmethylation protein Kti12